MWKRVLEITPILYYFNKAINFNSEFALKGKINWNTCGKNSVLEENCTLNLKNKKVVLFSGVKYLQAQVS